MRKFLFELVRWDIHWNKGIFSGLIMNRPNCVENYGQSLNNLYEAFLEIADETKWTEATNRLISSSFYSNYIFWKQLQCNRFSIEQHHGKVNSKCSKWTDDKSKSFINQLHCVTEIKKNIADRVVEMAKKELGSKHPNIIAIEKERSKAIELLEQVSIDIQEDITETTPNIEDTDNILLAKGVGAIANILGCGKTKAQAILNTGFLSIYEVGYYLGRSPILEIEKWNKLPSEIKSKIITTKR